MGREIRKEATKKTKKRGLFGLKIGKVLVMCRGFE